MVKILFFFFFLISFVHGQEKSYPEIDSALKHKTFSFAKAGKHNEGITFNFKLIEQSRQNNYKKGIGWGYLNIGNLYSTLNQYQESLRYLELAEKELDDTTESILQGRVQVELGKVNHFLGLYEVALQHYNKAIRFYTDNKNVTTDKGILSYALACKATNFSLLKQPDSMYFYIRKSYKVLPEPITAVNIAIYFIDHRRAEIDSAKYYLDIANAKLQKNDYPIFQKLVVLRSYGNFYFKTKEFDKALKYFLQSLALAKKIKKEDEKINILLMISNTYKALKDDDKAEKYFLEYTRINDSLNTKKNTALNISVGKLIQDSVQELEKEKEQVQKSNLRLMGFAIFGFIFFGIFAYTFYMRKKKEKDKVILSQQQAIMESHTENRKLENQVNTAFDEVLQLAKKNDPSFLARFKEVYPEFCNNLLNLFPDMTSSELTFCAYLKLNLSSKEIANYTFVSLKAVQVRKSRIRKKFNIPSEDDLYFWINKI